MLKHYGIYLNIYQAVHLFVRAQLFVSVKLHRHNHSPRTNAQRP